MLFYNSFTLVFSEGCIYQKEKDGPEFVTNDTYPINNKAEAISLKKKKCFDYSYSAVFQQVCCYDEIQDACTSKSTGNNISCPIDTTIPNNCGTAGIFEPAHETSCTEIGLVNGYCCYVDFGKYGKSCIKTNKLNDDKNTATEMIEQYIKKYNDANKAQAVVTGVICDSHNLKIASRILLFCLLLLI